jgi:ascorbate-specific PTS system EIIC-type component UlaA
MIDWNLIGVILAWVAGILGAVFTIAAVVLVAAFNMLERIDVREQNDMKRSWFWNGE